MIATSSLTLTCAPDLIVQTIDVEGAQISMDWADTESIGCNFPIMSPCCTFCSTEHRGSKMPMSGDVTLSDNNVSSV